MTRIALTGVAFVLAIGAFDTNHTAARAADVDANLLNDARSNSVGSRQAKRRQKQVFLGAVGPAGPK